MPSRIRGPRPKSLGDKFENLTHAASDNNSSDPLETPSLHMHSGKNALVHCQQARLLPYFTFWPICILLN